MAISENPSASEIRSALRYRALIWASEYHDDELAEKYADWYANTQPALSHVDAFNLFQTAGS